MAPFLSQAWQSWKNARASALLTIVALTVGIGSATAMYAVIRSLLLKPLPYTQGERWVSLLGASRDDPKAMSALNVSDVLAYRQMRSFDAFGWMQFVDFNLTAPGQPQYLNGVRVTPPLANAVGVNPRLGRWFTQATGEPEAVISDALWLRLGGDPALVGKPITLSGRIYTVAGVMPRGFNLPLAGVYGDARIDVWVPLDPTGADQDRISSGDFCYARLRPGVTVSQADAEVKRVAAEIVKHSPGDHHNYSARVDGLHDLITKEIRPTLMLLLAAALLLLLITCANVGGLLLARAVARSRETAIRVALGAGMRQLAAQYFLEGLLVSLPGAAAGLLLSAALIRWLVTSWSSVAARVDTIAIDWGVLVFTVAAALLACALTSMAPLWQAARTLPNDVLSEGVRASAGARSRRVSRAFVVAEVALAFVLLTVSTALIAELYRVTRVDPGFDPRNLLTFQIAFSPEGIPGKPSQHAYQTQLLEAVQNIPGVQGAGIVNQVPLAGCCFSTAIFQEGPSPRPSTGERVAFLPVNPEYWRTMGIPLRAGRLLTAHDNNEKSLTAVINQAAVRRYWPDRDPVGAYGHFGNPQGDRFQVVGVVGDVKNNGLDAETVPEVYLNAAVVSMNPINFVVRSKLPPGTLVPEIRRAIQSVNREQPIHQVKTMEEIARESVSLKVAASSVISFFALAALLMATIGTYGVVSYSVRQRTVEMGTRMALGATARDLLGLVMGAGLRMAGWGVAIGGVAAALSMWLLVTQYHMARPGMFAFPVSALTLGLIALGSSLFPAWRATMLSPMVAIRDEPTSMRLAVSRIFERWSTVGDRGEDLPASPDAGMMTALIDASRQASGFREAIGAALEALRANLGAQSAMLLEAGGEELRATASTPEAGWGACAIPRNGWLVNRLRAYGAPLPIEEGDLDAGRRWAAESKPEHLAEIATLESSGARLAVALRTNQEVLGVLLLSAPADRASYSRTEKRVLRGCADQFAMLLENARLTDRVVEQEKVLRDLALAAEVQKRLLPRQGMETAVASLTGLNLPARSVGGDYYDFLELGAEQTGIALADVAGKGIAAALIMSVVQASLRVISGERQLSLPQLAAKMNYFLYRSTGPNSYATFFYAQLDQRTRELRYVNAGHNAPYLLRAGGELEELNTGGTIIGMFPQTRYEEGAMALHTGDVLIVFSDGVPEALNPADEEFGEDRLKDLLRAVSALPVEEMAARVAREMRDWIQDAAQYDDLTFLLVKVK